MALFLVIFYRSGCRDIILRLLHKDDWRRLGSKTGASEVKQHRWFATLKWGLLRNETPPIQPTVQKDGVGVNVRHMKESVSLDLEDQKKAHGQYPHEHRDRGRSRKDPHSHLPPGAAAPHSTHKATNDPFSGFSSVTLHYDGEN